MTDPIHTEAEAVALRAEVVRLTTLVETMRQDSIKEREQATLERVGYERRIDTLKNERDVAKREATFQWDRRTELAVQFHAYRHAGFWTRLMRVVGV